MSRKGLNIYKRKDGRWEARYIKSRNALGKPKYGYLYASSYREVRCDLQHTLQLQGKPSGSEERTRNSTFELVSMEWLDAFSINFKESTYIRYRTLIECYLMPSFQTVKIEKITKEMVRKLCKHLELHGKKDKTGLSPKTISDVLSVLRRILNYAGTIGISVDSKVLDIRVKQTQKSLPILSLPEQMILQQYLEEHPDALNLGILLCLLTGIRIGELCALTWEKISISERNIYICQTMQRIQNRVPGSKKTHIEIASPKSSSANRNFFMQFALVTGVRMLTIMWIPVLIQFATLLLAAVVAAASRSYLAAMLLVMIGMIAALVVAAYRSYQFWPMALVQADHPQLNAEQVMERCKVMTEGHKFDLFVFDLSYLGWNILSLLTGGILSVLYVAPYKMIATAFVYEEMKGRPVMVDDIKPSTDGNGMTIAVDPKKLMGIGNTGGKKPTSHIPAASRAAGAALEGVAGMYAGSSYPLEPNQPVILGRDPAYAKIVFSQGAQKISRRHCEVMFNSQVQKYRVTDFSSNGTYVNGSRLPANSPVLLARGTELALGDNNNIIRLS